MGPIEIAVIVIVCAVVVAIVSAMIVRKIKGKPSLGSDCCGCPYAKDCDHNCRQNHGADKSGNE